MLQISDAYLECGDQGTIGIIFIQEKVTGILPRFDTPSSKMTEVVASPEIDYLIDDLESGENYHVRVSAWNGVGSVYGSTKYSTPAVSITSETPNKPINLFVEPWNENTLRVSWKSLEGNGTPVTKFYLEWDTKSTFQISPVSKEVGMIHEVHRLYLSAINADFGGFFHIHFMGEVSERIYWDCNANDMKRLLENLSTINEVEVSSNEVLQSSLAPASRAGREWIITFTGHKGNIPSLLVSTGLSIPSIIAVSGSLTGTSVMVEVSEIQQGGIPTSCLISDSIAMGQTYFVRLKAFNENGWSSFVESVTDVGPRKQVPSKPRNVVMNVISQTEIGVSWTIPENSGSEPITKYTIQWDINETFYSGASSILNVDNRNDIDTYHIIVPNLIPNERYFVRVLAYNNIGYGEARLAVNFDSAVVSYKLSLFSENEDANINETFGLKYISNYGNEQITKTMKVNCATLELEENLNKLDLIGVVSVTKVNYEIDGPFLVQYLIRVFGLHDDGVISFVDYDLHSISSSFDLVSLNKYPFSISPISTTPTGPRNAVLTTISNSELGISWLSSAFSGGSTIDSYLVEWCQSHSFGNDNNSVVFAHSIPAYTNQTTYSYQIMNLNPGTIYFVRISAHNNHGYSIAAQSRPSSIMTSDTILYHPTDISVSISSRSIANRIEINWVLPTVDEKGFNTTPDSCGVSNGHTPLDATAYHIKWSKDSSMQNTNSYTAFMRRGDDDFIRCCTVNDCSVEIGAEVQQITVNSYMDKPITSGSLKVIYVGIQSHKMYINVTPGSKLAQVSSQLGSSEIAIGDYMLVQGKFYKIEDYEFPTLTLSNYFDGTVDTKPQLAYFNTPPSSCFDLATNNSAYDMQLHIDENFDNSPFGEEIRVSKHSFSSKVGVGSKYDVTFIGPSFYDETTNLLIEYCSSFFEVDGSTSFKPSVSTTTLMESTTLESGTKYYFQIAAINPLGMGPFGPVHPLSVEPKAPPGLATKCKVYAIPTSSDSLRVEWSKVALSNGSNVTKYEVEFYHNGYLNVTNVFEDINIGQTDSFSIVQSGLHPGWLYEVNVVAVNDVGRGKFRLFDVKHLFTEFY